MPLGKAASESWLRIGQLNQQLAYFRGQEPKMPEGQRRWRAARRKILQARGVFGQVADYDAHNEVVSYDLQNTSAEQEVSSNVSSESIDDAILKNDPFWGSHFLERHPQAV